MGWALGTYGEIYISKTMSETMVGFGRGSHTILATRPLEPHANL